jgi:tetratricopeptide (TPR) repeat protein
VSFPADQSSIRPLYAGLAAAFIALCAFAAFYESPRLWGLHYAAFLPPAVRVLFLLGAAVACVPLVAKPAAILVDSVVARAARFAGRKSALTIAVVAAFAVVLLWSVRDAAHLLGDGRLLIDGIESGRWWVSHEGLDFALHAATHRVMMLFGESRAALSYEVVSVIAGVLYLAAAVSLARAIARSSTEQILIVLVLSCLGFVQVFFGYAESYAFAFPAVLLYFRCAYRAIAGLDRAWKAVALYVVLTFLHSTFVTYALSLGVVIFLSTRRSAASPRAAVVRSGAFAALLGLGLGATLVLTANLAAPGDTAQRAADHVLPLVMSDDVARHIFPYAALSATHATNLANQVLLVVPGVLVLAIALFASRRLRRLRSLSAAESGFLTCVFAAWIPHALGFLLFKPAYAGFGDWDLLSLPAPAFAIAVTCTAIYLTSRQELAVLALATCGLQGLTVVPQVMVNADAQRGVKRYLHLLREYREAWDVFSMGIGYTNLVKHYASVGDNRQVIDLSFESFQVVAWSPTLYERSLQAFATQLDSEGREAEALSLYRERIGVVLTRFRSVEEQQRVGKAAGTFFYRHKAYEDACQYFEVAATADTIEYDAYYALAAAQHALGRSREAQRSISEAMRRTPADETRKRAAGYLLLSSVHEGAGQREQSIAALKAGLEVEPGNSELRAALEEATAQRPSP